MKQINKKEICIIGGSGFIGKSIIHFFNKRLLSKYNISKLYVICRNPYKIKSDKRLSLDGVELIRGDISRLKTLPTCEYYIYLAEPSNIKKYKNKKRIFLYKKSINNFCKILKRYKKESTVLYVSSGSLDKKINVDYKNYNLVKKNSEITIKKLSKAHNKKKILIARCYSFISEFLPLDKHFAIGNFIKDGLDKKKKYIKIKSSFRVYRSYMHSDDLCSWLVKILILSYKSGIIYRVGSQHPYEIGQIAKIVGKLTKKKVIRKKIFGKKIDKYIPNLTEAEKKLGLKLKYNLIDSIKKTLKSLKKYEKKSKYSHSNF